MNKIDVLHRYGARRHYVPLERLTRSTPESDVEYYEFTLTTNPLRAPRNLRYLIETLTGLKPVRTVVLGAEPFDLRLPMFCKIANQYPLIYHTSWPYWANNHVPRAPFLPGQRSRWIDFLRGVEVVTVTGAAKRALSDCGVEACQIPHAVDTSVYRPERGQGSESVRVLFVGRLERRKGVTDLLRMAREGFDRNVTLQFVGDGPLRDRVERHAVSTSVEYEGYVDDQERLADIYAAADIFVLPSRPTDLWEELFGIVLIEAMASGLPVVSTDCVGPREVVDDGKNGYLVDSGSYDGIRGAVDRLVANPGLRAKMGASGREKAQREYALDVVADAWRTVIEGVG